MLRPFLAFALHASPLVAQTILPPPPVPAGNPQTPAKVLLGKALFWDEQLSSSRTVACGTCHRPAVGGSDPRAAGAVHPGSDGVPGTPDDVHGSPGIVRQDAGGGFVPDPAFGLQAQVTGRKAPSMINAAYAVDLFDDGRATGEFHDPVSRALVLPAGAALESQAAQPPVSGAEMSHLGRTWDEIAIDLAGRAPLAMATNVPPALQQFVNGRSYAELFQQVFGSPGVTPVRIVFAIAAYERTLISDQSRFDRYLAGQGTLTPIEQAGLTKFQELCAGCHTDLGPYVRVTGPVLDDYRNIGVRPPAEDAGRAAVTGAAGDRGRFRVPGLRNVALRAPYFHNGSMPTLTAVIDFYARGGDFQENQDDLIAAIPGHVSVADHLALQSLLQSLTDPRVAAEQPPFDRPTLWSEGPRATTRLGDGTAGSGGFAPRSAVNMLPFRGNARFALGLDRTAPGLYALLALDVATSATPLRILGQEIYLGLTPALVVIGLPRPTQGQGGSGYATLRMPVPASADLADAVLYGQWIVVDPVGPEGLASSDALAFTIL